MLAVREIRDQKNYGRIVIISDHNHSKTMANGSYNNYRQSGATPWKAPKRLDAPFRIVISPP